jgi:hypothetical protein
MKKKLFLVLCTSTLSWAMENINSNLPIPKATKSSESTRTRQYPKYGEMVRSRRINVENNIHPDSESKIISVTRYNNKNLPR